MEMGIILTLIEKESPCSITYKAGTADEVLINFDSMVPKCFHEVNRTIQGYLGKKSKAYKKKRPIDEAGSPPVSATKIKQSKK